LNIIAWASETDIGVRLEVSEKLDGSESDTMGKIIDIIGNYGSEQGLEKVADSQDKHSCLIYFWNCGRVKNHPQVILVSFDRKLDELFSYTVFGPIGRVFPKNFEWLYLIE
jgi:hypothetical protein